MKKYFIVSDVHSFYDEMMKALNEKGWDSNNPDHIFVSLGDMFDRGPQSCEVMDFLMSIPEDRRIFILGNHELLMEDMISCGDPSYHDFTNGTVKTAVDLTNTDLPEYACVRMRTNKNWNTYIHACQPYAEIGDNIFVHGWIPCHMVGKYNVSPIAYDLNWRNASIREWKNATWINGMEAWDNGIREYGKTIWCGHWHTSWGHAHLHHNGVEFPKEKGEKAHFSPFKDEGIVAMDACTVFSHKVNCEVVEMDLLSIIFASLDNYWED